MRNLVKTWLAVLAVSLNLATLGLAGPASAGPWEDGLAAWQHKDYAAALRLWLPLAGQGNDDAQHGLGFLYANGQGVTQDDAEAIRWYRRAADLGHAAAQYNLGVMHAKGQGVKQDYANAVRWWREAADRGIALAQGNLASMYTGGHGVPQDYVQAHKWFDLAAAARYPSSESNRRITALANRDVVARLMTPAQIAEARKLALEWQPK